MIIENFEQVVLDLTSANTLEDLTDVRIKADYAIEQSLQTLNESIMTSKSLTEITPLCHAYAYAERQNAFVNEVFLSKCEQLAV